MGLKINGPHEHQLASMRINQHQSESINQLLSPSTNNNQHQSAIIINHHQYEFHSQKKKIVYKLA